jgi:hypothetical protein
VPLIGVLAFVAGWHVGRLRDRTDAGSLSVSAIGLAVSAAVWVVRARGDERRGRGDVGVIVVASADRAPPCDAAVWSWPLRRTRRRRARSMWALGTPDSPVCDADSWLQPHGSGTC